MPRNHYFQIHYPHAAAKQAEDQALLANTVWHAFTKYTGLQKLFSFTVLPLHVSDKTNTNVK
jgi:hypothetical protein